MASINSIQQFESLTMNNNDKEPVEFNIFVELLKADELTYELSRHLDVEDFATLYSVSARFHRLINQKLSTCLERNAATNAPESAAVFPWRCYRSLCIYDPMRTQLERQDAKTGKPRVRDAPSLRWLRMIWHREEMVDSIVLELAEAGHRLPPGTKLVIKKLWFLMDYPDTGRRIGIVHNQRIWSDHELLLATMFFIKLDMRFTDPMDGRARLHVRHMLMAQPTMTKLAAVLERRAMTAMFDFLRMFVEWRMKITDGGTAETLFGLPTDLAGRLMQQGWTNNGRSSYLMPIDDLILKEGIRRNLRLNRWYLDMLVWGNIDPDTLEDIWPPSIEKERAEMRKKQDEMERRVRAGEYGIRMDMEEDSEQAWVEDGEHPLQRIVLCPDTESATKAYKGYESATAHDQHPGVEIGTEEAMEIN